MKIRHKLSLSLCGVGVLGGILGAVTLGLLVGSIKSAAIKEAVQVAQNLALSVGYEMTDPINPALIHHADLQGFVDILQAQQRDIVIVDTSKKILADVAYKNVGAIFSLDPGSLSLGKQGRRLHIDIKIGKACLYF